MQRPTLFGKHRAVDEGGGALLLSAVGCLLGIVFGTVLSLARLSRSRLLLPFKVVALVYVEVFRRVPFLVTLLVFFFGAQVLGFDLSPLVVTLISTSVISTAFVAEIIRAGLAAVRPSQLEAAEVMNFSPWQILWLVRWPQAWPLILPPVFGYFVLFIKDTALASQIGVLELTQAGKILNTKGFSALLVFATVLILYFLISYPWPGWGPIWRAILAHLDIRGLTASYANHTVLDGINLTVERGEIVSLIGPSGSGKSTLLRVITGLLRPERGEIILDGERIDYADRRSLKVAREKLAIVFQQYNLFGNMTVLGNVTVAPAKIRKRDRSEVEADARRLLEKVGLGDKLNAYPDELSGGQQQRVALARALCLKLEILLLDEVTSALDPERVSEVLDTIKLLASDNITLLTVSHEMNFVREVSDRVVFMANGEIQEIGRPEQIFDAPQVQRTREFTSRIARVSDTDSIATSVEI
ncbi:amino acid ABC transporter permease/ATP-binding protein [Rhizobium sp. 1AS11]|nr:amino acid ABC transporter permease/ATP-binding protein [Rhizobium acaciae]MCW1408846.1 amino acid ABC transporter permease/ATP-binding protein [Rhizobium acaciae]MCW1741199.1 amino acid ABC transporter permease/ATP-binding protein [Rhizobium acaciae]MCW1749474.1 amino acid ABC transporter permease/ATP-binding protein [Rhizobium acaciae]